MQRAFCALISILTLASPAFAAGPSYLAIDLTAANNLNAVAYAASSGQQVGVSGPHAVIWSGAASSLVDLNPAGYYSSGILDISSTGMVGGGFASQFSPFPQALYWPVGSSTPVILAQSGNHSSSAQGIGGNEQAGFTNSHAVIWHGTAASMVDIHPSGYETSMASATNGTTEVGEGFPNGGGGPKALLWRGTAASALDLTPSGFETAQALDIYGNQAVGRSSPVGGNSHAILWNTDTTSFVDLTPAGAFLASAYSISNGVEVGEWSADGSHTHAMAWFGSAAANVDLHGFLPSTFTDSLAWGVDVDGSIVGSAYVNGSPNYHAILWVPIPEPSGIAYVFLGGFVIRRRLISVARGERRCR